VSADLLGPSTMDMDYSGPIQGRYYTDYDATIDYSFLGLGVSYEDIFCVENAPGIAIETDYDFYTVDSSLIEQYENASNQNAYAGDWLLAVSPPGSPISIGAIGQNYLVPNPVPEPKNMLFLGIGLIGIASIGRRHLSKKY